MAYVQDKIITLPVATAISEGARVKMSNGLVVAADAEDIEIGVLAAATTTADSYCSVVVSGPVVQMIAASSMTIFAAVYGAASGKVNDVASDRFIGYALEAASGDGSLIKVLYIPFKDADLAT